MPTTTAAPDDRAARTAASVFRRTSRSRRPVRRVVGAHEDQHQVGPEAVDIGELAGEVTGTSPEHGSGRDVHAAGPARSARTVANRPATLVSADVAPTPTALESPATSSRSGAPQP